MELAVKENDMRAIEAITPKRSAGRLYRFNRNRFGKGWVFTMQFGPGAGYCRYGENRKVAVHGRTVFVAWRSGSRSWNRKFCARQNSLEGWVAWHTGIEVGVTRNANRVPYASS